MNKTPLQHLPCQSDILRLLNAGAKVQLEYNPKNKAVYISEIKRKKINIILDDQEVKKMRYYRVRKEYDNFPQNPRIKDGNILIANELYTEKEFNKLPYIYAGAFEMIDIPKNQTYWMFGARFAE